MIQLPKLSLIAKQRLIIAALIFFAILISIGIYGYVSDWFTDVKIQKTVKKAAAASAEVEDKKDEINQQHKDFVKSQDEKVKQIISIRDHYKNNHKKISDEVPEIPNAAYDVMLDSLAVAMPD